MKVQVQAKRRVEALCERDGAGLAARGDLLGLAPIEGADDADDHAADLARGEVVEGAEMADAMRE